MSLLPSFLPSSLNSIPSFQKFFLSSGAPLPLKTYYILHRELPRSELYFLASFFTSCLHSDLLSFRPKILPSAVPPSERPSKLPFIQTSFLIAELFIRKQPERYLLISRSVSSSTLLPSVLPPFPTFSASSPPFFYFYFIL